MNIEEIFDICLEKMEQGESIDQIVKEYPECSEDLESLLRSASNLKKSVPPEPRKEAISVCLDGVKEEARQIKRNKQGKKTLYLWNVFYSSSWSKAAAIVLIVVLIPLGAVNISASSIPGDKLYPVKILSEKIRYICCMTINGKVELRLKYSEERMKELHRVTSVSGQLDKKLLKSMLDEADTALNQMNQISEQDKDLYFSKLEYLSAHQEDTLKNLREIVPTHQKKALETAIHACNCRAERMSKMRKNEVPQCQWGPGCCE